MSRVDFTALAESDLEAIGDYIAQDNPQRALSFLGELRSQCDSIAREPLAYRARSELATGLRSCAYGRYVIFFQPCKDGVLVVRILHAARDVQAQFLG